MAISIEQILMEFKNSIDEKKDYSLKQLTNLLVKAHTQTLSNADDEIVHRVPPSQYNKYMRHTMQKLKTKFPDKSMQDIMQLAEKKWLLSKQ